MKRDFRGAAYDHREMRFRVFVAFIAACAFAQDAREIFRRSAEKDQQNRALRRQYTYLERGVERELDKNGKTKSTHSTTRDVSILYGNQFSRLIEKDGKPLSDRDQRKEQDRLAKFTAKWGHETPQERKAREEEHEKNRAKIEAFLKEIPDAFDLRLLPSEKVDGHDTWVIQAEPHPGYRPKTDMGKYLSKVHGKVWIDKAEYQWVKVDAETIDTISFGLVLFRLFKGSRIEFEQARVNDEIWLPRRQHISAAGRMGIFLKAALDADTKFENYRKFQTDSKVVATVP
jgi:hypothetical protein